MMIKHRKLFPLEYNDTVPCPDFCAATCPDGCYPYVDVYPPSPPPPLPQNSPKHGGHVSPFVIVIVTLLASCFIVISFYLIAVRCRCRWNFLRPRRGQPEAASTEEFIDEDVGPTAIDYPIWYINTVGLQPSIIDSITIFSYKKGASLIEGTECAVCLNEFQNDDTLRLLPKCSHAFHIPCIDTWLRSHINCPVCRAGIVSGNATSIPVASNALNSNNLRPNEDFRAESRENGEILNIREDGFSENENRRETEEIIEVERVDQEEQDVEIVKANMIPKGTSASWIIEDSEDKRKTGQSVTRSVSVDSLLAPNVSEDQIADRDGSSNNVCGNSRRVGASEGTSLVAQLLHKRPVRMKRSSSYSGRSLFSRQHSRSNLVLPLESPETCQFRFRGMASKHQLSE